MARVALGLGTNLGNRLAHLREATQQIGILWPVLKKSDVFETKPWGVLDQPYFLNACLLVESNAEPEPMLQAVKEIERRMGRVKNIRWGSRLIDIDILLMEDKVLKSPEIEIPHACLHEREFVLTPLRQILPDWVHPINRQTVIQMAEKQTSSTPPLRITGL